MPSAVLKEIIERAVTSELTHYQYPYWSHAKAIRACTRAVREALELAVLVSRKGHRTSDCEDAIRALVAELDEEKGK